MQDDVALLGDFDLQVGQALPGFQVPGAGDAALRHGRRCIPRGRFGVFALGAEEAVDPAVLVLDQAHVVDVGVGIGGLGHQDRIIPEAKVVDAVRALGDGEEGFAVGAFDARDDKEFSFVQDGAGVEGGVDADALHQKGIGLAGRDRSAREWARAPRSGPETHSGRRCRCRRATCDCAA